MQAQEKALMEVINLDQARAAREPKPDPQHMFRDAKGEMWFEFTCSFEDDTDIWVFSIWARNWDEAESRLALMKQNAKVDGQIYSTVDA